MLIIRTDADAEIGTGHAMRCLALAQAWQAAGGRAVVLGHQTPEVLCKKLRAADVEFQPLGHRHPDPADLATTLRMVDRLIGEDDSHDIPWLAIDGYHFDSQYIEGARQSDARLLVIDDQARLDYYDTDAILNQNLGAEETDYPCDEHTTLLLGSRYALLRQEFLAAPRAERTQPPVASKILVTLGGADRQNTTGTVVEALKLLDLPGLEAKIVVGAVNRNVEAVRSQVAGVSAKLEIVPATGDMAALMAWADVAVAAGGSTVWELAYQGLPAALAVAADNQERVVQEVVHAGAAISLGPADALSPQKVAEQLASLCQDAELRQRQSAAGRRLIDGRGASRVVAILHTLDAPFSEDRLKMRPAECEDARTLWRLANDPVVRKGSLSTETIGWDEHLAWFERFLADDKSRIWVLDCDGVVLASIRYERTALDVADVSVSVAAPFRRRGLASRMIRQTWNQACNELNVDRIRAVVRADNIASRKTFVQAGFAEHTPAEINGTKCEVFEKST